MDIFADQLGGHCIFDYVEQFHYRMVPGAADRLDIGRNRPSKSEGRRTLPKQSPNGCLGQLSPFLARPGQYYGEVNMK